MEVVLSIKLLSQTVMICKLQFLPADWPRNLMINFELHTLTGDQWFVFCPFLAFDHQVKGYSQSWQRRQFSFILSSINFLNNLSGFEVVLVPPGNHRLYSEWILEPINSSHSSSSRISMAQTNLRVRASVSSFLLADKPILSKWACCHVLVKGCWRQRVGI